MIKDNILPFLFTTLMISLSGVISPGPLTSVAVSYGLKNKNAGFLVSIGHSVVELPLIILVYLGIVKFLSTSVVKTFIGIIGGVILIILGIKMFQQRDSVFLEIRNSHNNIVVLGLITTISNPYFFLWWFTIGTGLIITASKFGLLGILIFCCVHLLCDFCWYSLITNFVYKTKQLLSKHFWNIVLTISSAALIFFGVIFIFTGLNYWR
ncbi:MAG: LysE family translocator [Endomicrobia bacterium]|nr:LysE family translocator [Endomicrobiia bacterium]MCX7716654.1 LysE family translocator [Endomicrobiia bacterium]